VCQDVQPADRVNTGPEPVGRERGLFDLPQVRLRDDASLYERDEEAGLVGCVDDDSARSSKRSLARARVLPCRSARLDDVAEGVCACDRCGRVIAGAR
jgi:hypothetical protein